MKSFRKVLMLILVAFMASSLLACGSNNDTAPVNEGRVIRVGMECAYAPYNWQEDTATASNLPIENVPGFFAEGFDVQVAKLIGEKLDAEIVIVKLSWEGLISALNEGQIDMIIAGMSDTPERDAINFSTPYRVPENVVVVNSGSVYEGATTLEGLSGASLLGQKDTIYDWVIDQVPNVNHLPAVENVPNMITRLEQGTVDGIVMEMDIIESYLPLYPNFRLIKFSEGNGFTVNFNGNCVGMRKTDIELLNEVNAAFEGEMETFNEMYRVAQEAMLEQ